MTFTRILVWTGTALTIAGALATSLRIDPLTIIIGYDGYNFTIRGLNIYLLNLGSASFLWWALRIREPAMIAVNGVLLAIYLIGLCFIER